MCQNSPFIEITLATPVARVILVYESFDTLFWYIIIYHETSH